MSSQKRPRFIAALTGSALIIAGLMVPMGVAAEEAPSGLVRPQVASSSTVGYWEAAQHIGGAGQIQSLAVAVASDDTVVVAGYFAGTAYFPTGPGDDSIALTSAGGQDLFVAALSADDSYFAWAQRAGGTFTDQARSVAVTSDDTILVTGYLGPSTSYFPKGPNADDSIAVAPRGNGDIFIAAMNANNSYFSWAQRAGGTDLDEANAVALSPDDSVLITGNFAGAASFPTGASTSITLNSANGDDVFVAAMNSDDSYFAWAQSVSGTGVVDRGTSVAVNSDGDIIVTGQFSDTASFPSGPSGAITLVTAGSLDIFVASLNSDDTYFGWAQRAGGTGSDTAWSAAVRGDDTVVLTGNFGGTAAFPTGPSTSASLASAGGADIFVAALNKDDSYFSWAQGAGGVNDDVSRSVAVRSVSPITITGFFGGTTYFPTGPGDDSIALTSTGGEDAFVATFNDDDTYFSWAQRAGSSTGSERGYGVALRSDDTPIVTGYFNGTASFPSSATTSIGLTALGANSNGFVGWLFSQAAPGPSPTPDPPAPVTYPPSAPLDASAVAGDASATVTWSAPASSGSFPVTNYQVTASPGGKTCLVAAPATTCTIEGLTNGTAYTFTVRALNGAGWSPDSAPSAPVTPKAPTSPTIVITGSRGTGEDRIGRVVVRGVTTYLAGALVQARVHLDGEVDYYDGSTRRVSDDETFTWQRKTKKKVYVYFTTEDASVRSNRLIINP